MKFLFDLLPVILFFAAFKISGRYPEETAAWLGSFLGEGSVAAAQAPILLATLVVILATVAQIAWVWKRHGKVDRMLWISLVLVVVFGGMTLAFRDESFIKWKPTLLYWAFAGSMGIAALAFRKNAIRAMLGEQMQLPEPVWARVNAAWIVFFIFMGCANLFVAQNFSTETWVDFKLFGSMGLLLAFVLAQGFVLSKYMQEEK